MINRFRFAAQNNIRKSLRPALVQSRSQIWTQKPMKAPLFAQNMFINQLRFFSTPTEAEAEFRPIPTFLPGEESVIRIPPNINAWKLGKLLDEEPMELLKILDEQTNEVITDEF
jgi:hypothetical protein